MTCYPLCSNRAVHIVKVRAPAWSTAVVCLGGGVCALGGAGRRLLLEPG